MGYTYEEYLEGTKGLILNSIYAGDRKRVEKEIIQACEKNKLYAVTYRMLKKMEISSGFTKKAAALRLKTDGKRHSAYVLISQHRYLRKMSFPFWNKVK